MTVFAFITALLPVFLEILKEVLPSILPPLIKALVYDPVSDTKNNLDSALAKGDLTELSRINQTVTDLHGQNDLTKTELDNMLNFVS